MEIIPAIDLIEGQCVRLSQGNYNAKTSYGDPLEMAKKLEAHGMKRLHLVDLDGAKAGKVVNLKVLESIAKHTQLTIDFGGGVRATEDVQAVLDAGASQVTGGSIAVKDPGLFMEWLQTFGSDKIILGADVKRGLVAIHGWEETSLLPIIPFLKKYFNDGIAYAVCTDVSKDGMLEGPAFKLYEEIQESVPELQLIASGGVSSVDDLEKLEAQGLQGVILGKALYEERISLKELEAFVQRNEKANAH